MVTKLSRDRLAFKSGGILLGIAIRRSKGWMLECYTAPIWTDFNGQPSRITFARHKAEAIKTLETIGGDHAAH